MTRHDAVPRLRGYDDLRAIEAVPLEARGIPRTTWEIVDRAAELYADELASVWVPDPARPERAVQVTYGQMRAAVCRYARVFAGTGLDPSDAVAFLTPNVSPLLPAMLGAQAVGAAAPMNPGFDGDRIAHLIRTAGAPAAVVAGPEFDADRWEAMRSRARRMGLSVLFALRPDLAVGDPPALGPARGVSLVYLDDAAALVPDGGLPGAPPRPDQIAAFFHTGGTTGAPKLAAHTHANEAIMAWSIATAVGLGRGSAILAGLPLFHVNGLLVTGMAPMLDGAHSVWPGPLGWRDPALVANTWHLIETFRISAMSAVPTVYSVLAGRELDADISTLRTPIVGAAPLPAPVAHAFEQRTGVPLQEGYGLSEAGCASSFTLRGMTRPGSVGQRLPYQRIAAAEISEDGSLWLLPAGEAGEIVISGPTVFAGYVVDREGQRSLDTSHIVDGWLRTGDLGRVDGEGRVWLSGRRKDLIIRGGHNIEPAVIEEALVAHPAVTGAGAVGRPDPHAGEVPVAFVTVDAEVEPSELIQWAGERIDERAARPVEIIILPSLPLTAVGKPFKPALRALTVERLVRAALADEGHHDAVVSARVTDSGIEVELDGARDAAELARDILRRHALDLEVVHV